MGHDVTRHPFTHYRKAFVFWECSCGRTGSVTASLAELAIRVHLDSAPKATPGRRRS